MNTRFTINKPFYALAVLVFFFTSCKKELSVDGSQTPTTTSAIVVRASASSQDSLYIVNSCNSGEHRDSISQSALPATISTYLSANYQGNTFNRAFAIKNSSGTTVGYVVVVYYNDKPVALRFDASGNFVKVLEQREKGDLDDDGYHHGGRFEDRDGMHRDTISLSSIPLNIASYMLTSYATDTLTMVFRDHDGNFVILTRNNGAFATIFNSNGSFVTRVALSSKPGYVQPAEQSSLPTTVLTYLTTTYPNYVFKKAFVIKQGSSVNGYLVFINANNTKYAVEFDASGSFVRAKTIY
jgi:hypothetical protein